MVAKGEKTQLEPFLFDFRKITHELFYRTKLFLCFCKLGLIWKITISECFWMFPAEGWMNVTLMIFWCLFINVCHSGIFVWVVIDEWRSKEFWIESNVMSLCFDGSHLTFPLQNIGKLVKLFLYKQASNWFGQENIFKLGFFWNS